MSRIDDIIRNIREKIYSNGRQAISGDLLRDVMVETTEGLDAIHDDIEEVVAKKADKTDLAPIRESINDLDTKTRGITTDPEATLMTEALDMQNNPLINLPTPTDEGDAVNLSYLEGYTYAKAETYTKEEVDEKISHGVGVDAYTKAESDRRVLFVKGGDTLMSKGISSLLGLSRASGMFFVENEGTIIPSVYEDTAWLYEYQEGWRLTHDISGFVITSATTFVDLLVWLDEHSDRLVGSDYLDTNFYTKLQTYSKEEINALAAQIEQEYQSTVGKAKQIYSSSNNTYPLLIANNHGLIEDHKTILGAAYYGDKVLVNPSTGEMFLNSKKVATMPETEDKIYEIVNDEITTIRNTKLDIQLESLWPSLESGVYTLSPNSINIISNPQGTFGIAVSNQPTAEHLLEMHIGETVPTVTWPEGVKFANGAAPTLNANKTYVVSIMNNLAVVGEF